MKEIFGQINYLAVITGGIAYWLVGMVWFSALFGRIWSQEIQNHGIKIKKPSSKEMAGKSLITFLYNLITSLGIAIFFSALPVNTLGEGLGFGLVIGICFAAMAMVTSYVWTNRSCKLSLIDIGYPIFGILVSSIIIALWR